LHPAGRRRLAPKKREGVTMATRKYKNTKWTPAEVQYLRANYGTVATAKIAKKLDRSMSAVYTKAGDLGLTRTDGEPPGPKAPKHKRLDIAPGDRVRVTLPVLKGVNGEGEIGKKGVGRRGKRQHTGRVLQVHERYILVQLPGWRECVNVGTVIAGEAQIELLERGKVA
jgi:hypothetical protein